MAEKIRFAEIAASEIRDHYIKKEKEAGALEKSASENREKALLIKKIRDKMYEGSDRPIRPIEESPIYSALIEKENADRASAKQLRETHLTGKNEDEQALIRFLVNGRNIRDLDNNKGIDALYFSLLFKAGNGLIDYRDFEKASSEVLSRADKEQGILSVDKKLLEEIGTALMLFDKVSELEHRYDNGAIVKEANKYSQIATRASSDAKSDVARSQFEDLASKLSAIGVDRNLRKLDVRSRRITAFRSNGLAVVFFLLMILLGPGFGKDIGYSGKTEDLFFDMHGTLFKYIPVAATLSDQRGRVYLGFGDLIYDPGDVGLPLFAPFAKLNVSYRNTDDTEIEITRGKNVSVQDCDKLETISISDLDSEGGVQISSNPSLKKIVIDAQMKSLSVSDCPNLEEIELLGDVYKTISLSDCEKLRSFSLPDRNLEQINITRCGLSSELVMPKVVSNVHIEECPNISSLVINNVTTTDVTGLGSGVYVRECHGLGKLEIKGTVDEGAGVELVGNEPDSIIVSGDVKGSLLFASISTQAEFVISGSVNALSIMTISDGETEYILPDGNIGYISVSNMQDVTSISFPKGLKKAHVYGCHQLTKVTVYEGTDFDYEYCKSLEEKGIVVIKEEE